MRICHPFFQFFPTNLGFEAPRFY